MRIFKWKKSKRTIQKAGYSGGCPCPCGCSPNPYFYVFDGKIGLTIEFQNPQELYDFKKIANALSMTQTGVKYSNMNPYIPQKRKKFNPSKRDSYSILKGEKKE